MRRLLAVVAAAIAVSFALPSDAPAWRGYKVLDATASWLAERPVTVRCLTKRESADDYDISFWGANAYVVVGSDGLPEPLTTVGWPWCNVLVNPSAYPEIDFAAAVLILTHESGHLRAKAFPRWDDEALVNCWAARRTTAVAVLRFGLPPEAAPYFSSLVWTHYRQQPRAYRFSGCQRP